MRQFRFPESAVRAIQEQLGIRWMEDDWSWDREWTYNVTRTIDAMVTWCKDSGITQVSTGFTQIEMCVTLERDSDAMLFKLRWHDVQRTPR